MTPLGAIGRALDDAWLYGRLRRRDRAAGRELRLVQDRLGRLGPSDILLVACLRNERPRMPAFVAHYRRLGVDRFLFVDNGSTDGFMDWAREQEDVSVWFTEASYRASAFGMLWCNDLLRRHGTGRWCVTVDPDEFLVYPYCETRDLRALCGFLDEEKRVCLHALLVDAYSDRPLADTVLREGADPFTVCPFFDRDGYVQRRGWGKGAWVQGGPRQRVHFRDDPGSAPAVNKIPLVKWRAHHHYRMSTHDARPWILNQAHSPGEVSPSGCLFHFKMVSALAEKAAEEMRRGEHYAASAEYRRYAAGEGAQIFHDPEISVRYENSAQLTRLGLMSPGMWF